MTRSLSSLFAEEAPRYWDKKLGVVPLEPRTKRPAKEIKGWEGYCNGAPTASRQVEWLKRYKTRGIGLLLGAEIGGNQRLGAIDVDRDEYVRLAEAVLGLPVISKIGKKGATFFVRYAGAGALKSSKIVDHEKAGVVDVLLSGRMTVMPPSRHPDTGQPYRWGSQRTLLDADLQSLPELDSAKLAVLKLVIGSDHAARLVTGSSTHEPGLALVATLVQSGQNDDVVGGVIRALLPPDYAGNSLDELEGWISSARAKGFDKTNPRGKKRPPSPADIAFEMLVALGAEFTHDRLKKAYMSLPTEDGGVRTYELGTRDASEAIGIAYYRMAGTVLKESALGDVISLATARAKFDGPQEVVYRRVARLADEVFVDLGRPDGRVVRITSDRISIEARSPVRFVRPTGGLPLPEPQAGGDLGGLKALLGLTEATFVLVLAFILGCLRGTGPFMCLLVEGQQGSGKSFLSKIIRAIVDPNLAEAARLPENERELMVFANSSFLLVFDNSSGMGPKISDLLCSIATGGSFVTRSLYTNEELHLMRAETPFIINGISDVATRPDLLERAISVQLERMGEGERKTEDEMHHELESILPSILGALYSIVSAALKNEPGTAPPRGIRMIDVARWLIAAEPAAGLPGGSFLDGLISNQTGQILDRINNEPLVIQLRRVLDAGPFEGTFGELLTEVTPEMNRPRSFPETAQHLAKSLERLKTSLTTAGVHFTRHGKGNKGQKLRVWTDGQEEQPPFDHPGQRSARQRRKIHGDG